ncbi:choline dehydrogenase [Thalassobius sp. Cn5-15]|uniref:choline dehydrogenase n=1 Tax=Thalassobius sp. Cn5-15 TaxID=2917763 RepID=UPI001EF21425|nr:choline dehydrogenase [Thalassobius sp. Cn5-15]MCG7493038.1 choline dehydrogenase [Thalassobius sp. Cn5-15]
MAKGYSHIVIGSGSAGGVIAARLSEDSANHVLVLEAGPMDRSLYELRMPAALAIPLESERFNWAYHSEPEPHLDGRQVYYPRGRVVGGSSSINGMVHLRGNPLDYEGWATREGLEEWSYAHCLPYFRKLESSAHGGEFRGDDGPIKVTIPECSNPLFEAFLEAGQQAGHTYTADVNGYRQEGVFRMERSTHNGRRSSVAHCYLHPARKSGRIDLKVKVRVTRILFDGLRAIGVEYIEQGNVKQAFAEVEVVLSAGAINSPQLLKLSGIGPRDELAGHGIDTIQHLPGVGENLQDHLDYLVQYHCLKPVSFYSATTPLGKLRTGAEWLFLRRGVGASNIWETGSFFRTHDGVDFPNMQHHFAPIAVSYDGLEKIEGHGFQFHISQMRPRSTGWVRLASNDPMAAPKLRFNHLSNADDRQEIRDAVAMTREFAAQQAFDEFRGAEIAPGLDAVSDAALDAFGRAKGETSHHPSCTCAMGQGDMSVVDGQGRVHGMEGLRVVDASIMPTIVSANINIPTIMMAEKIADHLRGRKALTPQHTEFYRNKMA